MGTETAITGRRGQLGITQAEAAAKADISVATWRRFEQSPGLGYRADTIRGVLRALRLSREELVQLLDGQGPAAIENPESAQHHANWNALWKKSTWPSITPRMAAAIQSELDSGRDILESDLANGTLHPEDSPLLHEFDLRVFIELGHNPVWFHAIVMRLVHLVDAMNKGSSSTSRVSVSQTPFCLPPQCGRRLLCGTIKKPWKRGTATTTVSKPIANIAGIALLVTSTTACPTASGTASFRNIGRPACCSTVVHPRLGSMS